MSQTSPQLNLPFIQPAQAQKHVTHNEAIELLDMIVQLTLEDTDRETPATGASEGQAWGIGPAPTGDWAGRAGQIATWRGGGWLYVIPRTGWRAWVTAAAGLFTWTGTAWIAAAGAGDLDNLDGVGINAASDGVNRLAVSADATLLNHDGAGHQLKLNKAAPGETASLLFQTAFSGRAEMGCAGDDDFAVKVSGGGSWPTAIRVAEADGAVSLPQMLTLPPRAEPVGAAQGSVYFDGATAKLRCFDGTAWVDLW